ncbi:MAG: SDR family oxidoreductase [Nocardioides sp.]|nr:SDR family oxidoreductase [Nocardioides sp.]
MGTYAVTGGASGMGAAVVERLRTAGHTVLVVDVAETADIVADLASHAGRRSAVEKVLAATGGRLDGAVMAAGLGPAPGRSEAITQVNYLGVVELLDGWREALAASGNSRVVVFGSNSSTTVPLVPRRAVRALLEGDVERALATYRIFGRQGGPAFAYAASKIAVSRWVRRHATTPEWIGAGIRLNAIAPGAVLTPLLERQLADPKEAKQVRRFPVPAGGFGDAGQLADWVVFMLGPAAGFLVGSIVFVDGGTDALLRPDDWPRPIPLRGVGRFVKHFRRGNQ